MDKSIKILLADDTAVIHLFMKRVFKDFPVVMKCVLDGELAIKSMEEEAFDLVFLDLNMPVLDGYKTASFIKKNSSWNSIPLIGMSAHITDEIRNKAINSGMSDCFEKPIKKGIAETLFKLHFS